VTRPQAAHTIAQPVRVEGVGLHSGAPCALTLLPHDRPGWWLRDAHGSACDLIPITAAQVAHTAHATTLALPSGARWSTLEHLLGAVSGLWLDALCIDLSPNPSAEAPILDGSARPWVEAITRAGLRPLPWARWGWRLDAPWSLTAGDGPRAPSLSMWPLDGAQALRRARYTIRYDAPLPDGAGDATWDEAQAPFAEAVAFARTFAFRPWLDALRAQGQIRGGALTNAVVFDDGAPLNPKGLRAPDEPARHKLLDLLGDLALLGAPLLADVCAAFGGHTLHAQAVARLRAALPSSPPDAA
jgi:UDP-3-O-[3-hydroxymyristoyl] N-acetylglucosamine deacetylase